MMGFRQIFVDRGVAGTFPLRNVQYLHICIHTYNILPFIHPSLYTCKTMAEESRSQSYIHAYIHRKQPWIVDKGYKKVITKAVNLDISVFSFVTTLASSLGYSSKYYKVARKALRFSFLDTLRVLVVSHLFARAFLSVVNGRLLLIYIFIVVLFVLFFVTKIVTFDRCVWLQLTPPASVSSCLEKV